MSQLTVFVPDEAGDSTPWQITCESCGLELPHTPTPDIHVFRVSGLADMVADERNAELIKQRLDALASSLPSRAVVIDAEISHEPPSLIERAIREHLATCTRARRIPG
jgi:hypothetical protein